MCEHPDCLEQKTGVFATEQELKTHTARVHGRDMSKAEKKQALTLPVAFNVRACPFMWISRFNSTRCASFTLSLNVFVIAAV